MSLGAGRTFNSSKGARDIYLYHFLLPGEGALEYESDGYIYAYRRTKTEGIWKGFCKKGAIWDDLMWDKKKGLFRCQ